MKRRGGGGRWAVAALVVLVALSAVACEYLDDRTRECGRLNVQMVNRPPGGPPIHIAPEHEAFGAQSLLGPGQSRTVELCVEEGDIKLFRAGRADGTPVHAVKCGVLRSDWEWERAPARVVWDVDALYCENW